MKANFPGGRNGGLTESELGEDSGGPTSRGQEAEIKTNPLGRILKNGSGNFWPGSLIASLWTNKYTCREARDLRLFGSHIPKGWGPLQMGWHSLIRKDLCGSIKNSTLN